MRLRLAIGVLLAALVTLPAALAVSGAAVARERSGELPERAFVLSLDKKQAIPAGALAVTENGVQVANATVSPASALGGQGIGTVLLIDASNSMRGAPIAGAMRAARAFAARNPNQPLAVVVFNDNVATVLPFTVDKESIDAALSHPPALGEGTHIYDGVAAAVQTIRDAELGAGRIVLLRRCRRREHDSPEEARQAATDAGVRVYTVGLESEAFDPLPLQQMAEASGAAYAQAGSSGDLAGIYDALGYKLSNEYLITYRSYLGPDEDVDAGDQGQADCRATALDLLHVTGDRAGGTVHGVDDRSCPPVPDHDGRRGDGVVALLASLSCCCSAAAVIAGCASASASS